MLKRPGIAFTTRKPSLNSLVNDFFSDSHSFEDFASLGIVINSNGISAITKVRTSIKKMNVIGNNSKSIADNKGPIIKTTPEIRKLSSLIRVNLSFGTIDGIIA